MNTPFPPHVPPPFPPFGPPTPGGPGFGGLGFPPGPVRRHARRHLRAQMRQHAPGADQSGSGPGNFPPSFGFGPGFGFGAGFRGGRRGPGRGRRGDVRAAILTLLAERPMHGYEMIQEIAERSNGVWKPSPGSVYPTLQLLVDEGLIAGTEIDGSKKLFDLTDEGRTAAGKIATPPWDEISGAVDPGHLSLRAAAGQLFGAVAQSAHAASPEQQQRIVDILNNARREIYQILGESE